MNLELIFTQTSVFHGSTVVVGVTVVDPDAGGESPYVLQTTYDEDMGDIAAALAAILG